MEEVQQEEIWKICSDFDIYEVSNLGQVRNKNTGRILKQSIKCGYMRLSLQNKQNKQNGKSNVYIHRLVAKEFIENPENKPQVNHIDKNRSNNVITNLEWTTSTENNKHRLNGIKMKFNTNVKVWRINKDTNEKIQLHNSIKEAGQWLIDNNYSNSIHNTTTTIGCVINGTYKISCGFKWSRFEQLNLENELWKKLIIDGKIYENYQVSSMGRFKNSKGIIMENYKYHKRNGYIIVGLDKNQYSLHRLIASTFLENPENKPVVNHIDGNKINNNLSNLEWCTVSENNQHAIDVGLKKFYKRKIIQCTIDGELVKEFNSIVEAVNETGIKTIKQVLYGKRNTSGGFIWKYLDKIEEN